jgi:ABC-type transporter Mla maintaining outer membrane lipid asymmetry permease subunit MlaE
MRVTEQIDAMEVSGTNLSNISLLHELWQPLYAAYISVFGDAIALLAPI